MTVRRAVPSDAAELARLRAGMFAAMGYPAPDDWLPACAEHFRERLAGPDFAAYVVDRQPGGRLAASGIGWVDWHLPSQQNPSGRIGHIASMSTDPDARRQGHARVILLALLEWFGELGVDRVALNASPVGEPLYRSVGFTEPDYPALQWRRTRPGPPGS